jgi:hypothetical protein
MQLGRNSFGGVQFITSTFAWIFRSSICRRKRLTVTSNNAVPGIPGPVQSQTGFYFNFNRDGCGIIQIYLLERRIVKFPTVEINSAFVSSCWGIIKIWDPKSARYVYYMTRDAFSQVGKLKYAPPVPNWTPTPFPRNLPSTGLIQNALYNTNIAVASLVNWKKTGCDTVNFLRAIITPVEATQLNNYRSSNMNEFIPCWLKFRKAKLNLLLINKHGSN